VDRYDLVHRHGLWNLPAWTAARCARRRRVPYVLSPHGMLDAGSMAHRAYRKRLAYSLLDAKNVAGAALLHATSRAEAQSLARRAPAVPIVVLPNGVDARPVEAPARGAFRRSLGLPETAPLIVFLGRVHPIKRLDLLAAAFDRIRVVHPGAHLVIAGPDEGGHRRRVEPRFAQAGASVHWTGELSEPAKWTLLADAGVLVMCSQSESFGRSVAEALAAGVPVGVTPGMTGADGIAELSRLVVRALSPAGTEPVSATVDVLSLTDPPGFGANERDGGAGIRFFGVAGGRARFVAAALRARMGCPR